MICTHIKGKKTSSSLDGAKMPVDIRRMVLAQPVTKGPVSAGFGTTSALGEISTAPPNCNSNPYEKRQRI